MSAINISEQEFEAVAGAALDAFGRGDMAAATALDKLARKINASLTNGNGLAKATRWLGGKNKPLTWEDMPSTFEGLRAAGIHEGEGK